MIWFHAQWLRYFQLPFAPELTSALRTESDRLVEKVVFGGEDYLSLFRAGETFLSGSLAEHYGLSAPADGAGWVSYGEGRRRGIFSHGAFLAVGAKFDDTSPTVRGRFVREYLMCEDIPPPPPNVKADEPPKGTDSPCKVDRYDEHTDVGCARCHKLMDPIGFGLEAYDRSGRFRTVEADHPECVIKAQGEVSGLGAFSGPGELSDLLIKSGKLEPCVVRQVFRFAFGRKEAKQDETALRDLTDEFVSRGRSFEHLLVEIAASPGFALKRLGESK